MRIQDFLIGASIIHHNYQETRYKQCNNNNARANRIFAIQRGHGQARSEKSNLGGGNRFLGQPRTKFTEIHRDQNEFHYKEFNTKINCFTGEGGQNV